MFLFFVCFTAIKKKVHIHNEVFLKIYIYINISGYHAFIQQNTKWQIHFCKLKNNILKLKIELMASTSSTKTLYSLYVAYCQLVKQKQCDEYHSLVRYPLLHVCELQLIALLMVNKSFSNALQIQNRKKSPLFLFGDNVAINVGNNQ